MLQLCKGCRNTVCSKRCSMTNLFQHEPVPAPETIAALEGEQCVSLRFGCKPLCQLQIQLPRFKVSRIWQDKAPVDGNYRSISYQERHVFHLHSREAWLYNGAPTMNHPAASILPMLYRPISMLLVIVPQLLLVLVVTICKRINSLDADACLVLVLQLQSLKCFSIKFCYEFI